MPRIPIPDGGVHCHICRCHVPTPEIAAKFLLGATWRFSCRACEPAFVRDVSSPATEDSEYTPISLEGIKRVLVIGHEPLRQLTMLPCWRKDTGP